MGMGVGCDSGQLAGSRPGVRPNRVDSVGLASGAFPPPPREGGEREHIRELEAELILALGHGCSAGVVQHDIRTVGRTECVGDAVGGSIAAPGRIVPGARAFASPGHWARNGPVCHLVSHTGCLATFAPLRVGGLSVSWQGAWRLGSLIGLAESAARGCLLLVRFCSRVVQAAPPSGRYMAPWARSPRRRPLFAVGWLRSRRGSRRRSARLLRNDRASFLPLHDYVTAHCLTGGRRQCDAVDFGDLVTKRALALWGC